MANMKKIPNYLTMFRIAAIPLLIAVFHIYGAGWLAFIIFSLAGITDFFDGYLARKFKAESKFGEMLDPIADKLLTAVALVYLLWFGLANIIPTAVILLREFLVSGLREFLAANRGKMPVTKLAKWKTASQFLAIAMLMLAPSVDKTVFDLGNIMLWLAGILTLITGVQYTKSAVQQIKKLPNPHTKLLPAPKKRKKLRQDDFKNIVLGER